MGKEKRNSCSFADVRKEHMRPSPRSNLLFSVFLCDLFVIIFIFLQRASLLASDYLTCHLEALSTVAFENPTRTALNYWFDNFQILQKWFYNSFFALEVFWLPHYGFCVYRLVVKGKTIFSAHYLKCFKSDWQT